MAYSSSSLPVDNKMSVVNIVGFFTVFLVLILLSLLNGEINIQGYHSKHIIDFAGCHYKLERTYPIRVETF